MISKGPCRIEPSKLISAVSDARLIINTLRQQQKPGFDLSLHLHDLWIEVPLHSVDYFGYS